MTIERKTLVTLSPAEREIIASADAIITSLRLALPCNADLTLVSNETGECFTIDELGRVDGILDALAVCNGGFSCD